MTNIIKMGTERLLPGEINDDLVEAIESLLDRAKKGELKALAWAGVTGNEHLVTGWEGAGGTMFNVAAGISCLNHRYAEFIMEDDA